MAENTPPNPVSQRPSGRATPNAPSQHNQPSPIVHGPGVLKEKPVVTPTPAAATPAEHAPAQKTPVKKDADATLSASDMVMWLRRNPVKNASVEFGVGGKPDKATLYLERGITIHFEGKLSLLGKA